MHNIFGQTGRLVVRLGLTFLLILAILVTASMLRNEYAKLEQATSELAQLQSTRQEIDAYLRTSRQSLVLRAAAMQAESLARLDARIVLLGTMIADRLEQQKQAAGFMQIGALPIGKGAVERIKRELDISFLRQEQVYLVRLRKVAADRLEHQQASTKLLDLWRQHVASYGALTANRQAQSQLRRDHPVASRIPGLPERRKLHALEETEQRLLDQNALIHKQYQDQKALRDGIQLVSGALRFEFSQDQVDMVLAPLMQATETLERQVGKSDISRMAAPLIEMAPTALAILLSIVLVPIGIKLAFYFILAPLAARRPPMCLIPQRSRTVAGVAERQNATISSVSQPIRIDDGYVLLVHPEYLQSATIGGQKDTKWLLDWSCPFTSLASGMYGLTRIRSESGQTIVVSATRDPFSEVGILSLDADEAIVLQPRSLAGVVYQQVSPLRITRHWRFNSLHAWLTLQFRYLVFHGPAQLIVKGCRGVRVEKAGNGHSISQAATIGFTANVAYSTIRCETFGAYLMGRQELLNDCFTGASGYYVYEEMPDFGKKAGITGRGIQGVTDSLLKVFGI